MYPEEIERVVLQVAGVAAACVVSEADELLGQVSVVWVVRDAAVPLDERAVRAHCEDMLPAYKVPRSIHFTAALPQTAAGKVARREVASAVDGEPQ